jgi:hypothetical protein
LAIRYYFYQFNLASLARLRNQAAILTSWLPPKNENTSSHKSSNYFNLPFKLRNELDRRNEKKYW